MNIKSTLRSWPFEANPTVNSSKRCAQPLRSYVLHHLLLLLFAMLLFWPLCLGRTLYWGDILLYFAPMLRFEQSSLQQGHIPLWNPYILCGQPFVGNPQLGVFYPATLLLTFLPVWQYLNIMIIGHVFLGGAAMTSYLKRWVRDPFAALIGGLVFMGNEYIVGRAQFPPMIFTAVYFPLMLHGIDLCLDSDPYKGNNHRRAFWQAHAILALIVGLMVMAAHPQMAYLILLFSCFYLLARLVRQANLPPTPGWGAKMALIGQRFPAIAAAILIGLLSTSVQILPALQLLVQSPRQHLSNVQANRFLLEPTHILTLLWPRYWGHPAASNYWGGGNAWEPAFFVGWFPLFLVCVAIRSVWKYGWKPKSTQTRIWFWTVSCLMGIWLAFGSAGGLYWLAFALLPGLSNFHDPARFLIYTVFAMATLTAFGWDVIINRTKALPSTMLPDTALPGSARPYNHLPFKFFSYKLWARPACFMAVTLPLLLFANDWNPTASNDVLLFKPTYSNPILASTYADNKISATASLNQGRISLGAQEKVWKHFITEGYTDYSTIRPEAVQHLLDTMLPNIGMNEGLLLSSGYEPVPVSAPSVLNDLANTALRRSEPNLTRLLALLDDRALLFYKPVHVFDPELAPYVLNSLKRGGSNPLPETATHAENAFIPITAWQNRNWLHIAWIVSATRRIEGDMRINAALTAPDFNPLTLAVLCDSPKAGEPDLEWGSKRDSSSDSTSDDSTSNSSYKSDSSYKKNVTSNSRRHYQRDLFSEHLFSDVYRRGTDEVQITVHNDIPNAMLVISTTAYPGWTATDEHILESANTNGKIAGLPDRIVTTKPTIHRVDGALMGIYLDKGQHHIILKYVPASYRIGLYLTMTACSLICFAVGMSLTSKLRRARITN